mmetsp:Transcript_6397/g.17203  ORF Transcript_6397/g.17203 Transcript_6397/m.17203 type:complete len:205 (-) Transcript_6397:37-651(-)
MGLAGLSDRTGSWSLYGWTMVLLSNWHAPAAGLPWKPSSGCEGAALSGMDGTGEAGLAETTHAASTGCSSVSRRAASTRPSFASAAASATAVASLCCATDGGELSDDGVREMPSPSGAGTGRPLKTGSWSPGRLARCRVLCDTSFGGSACASASASSRTSSPALGLAGLLLLRPTAERSNAKQQQPSEVAAPACCGTITPADTR